MAPILLHGTLHATIYEATDLHSGGGPGLFGKVLGPDVRMMWGDIVSSGFGKDDPAWQDY